MKLPRGRKAAAIGLVLGLAVSGGLVFARMSTANTAAPEVSDPQPGQLGVMLALDDRVINLRTGGAYRYAKVGVTVELRPDTEDFYSLTGAARASAETAATAALAPAVPLLVDAVGSTVAAADPAGLVTPEGRESLKARLLEALRAALGERRVLAIYFTDFVMQ